MAGELTRKIVVQAIGETEALDNALRNSGVKIDDFKKRNATAAAGAGALGNRYAIAGRQIAGSLEAIARTGRPVGEATKGLITQASLIATAFGPTGAIVGGIGILGLAFTNLFVRVRKESKETVEAIKKDLDSLQDRGDVEGLLAQARELEFGKPSSGINKATGEFTGSIRDLNAQIAALETASRNAGTYLERIPIDRKLAEIREQLKPLLELQRDIFARAQAPGPTLRGTGTLPGVSVTADSPTRDAADIKKFADESNQRLRALVAQINAGRKATAEFRKEFAQLIARSTSTAVDEIVLQFDALIAKARELGLEAEAVALERLRDSAVASTRTLENVAAELDAIERTSKNAAEEYNRIQGLIDQVNVTLQDTTLSDEDRAKLNEQLHDLYKKQGVALAKVTNASDGVVDSTDKTLTQLQATARVIDDAVRGALQLAQAFGLIDENASRTLQSISQIATGIAPLAEAIKSGTTGDVIGAALPVVGGIASLVEGLFGGNADARRFREEMQKELDAWSRALGDWVDSLREYGTALANTLADIDRHSRDSIDELNDWLRRRSTLAADVLGGAGGDVDLALRRLNELAKTGEVKDAIRALRQYNDAIAENAEATIAATEAATKRAMGDLQIELARAQGDDVLATTLERARRLAGAANDAEREVLQQIFAAEDVNRNVERTSGTMTSVSRATEMQFDRSLALDTARNAKLDTLIAVMRDAVAAARSPLTPPAFPGAPIAGVSAGVGAVSVGPITINVYGDAAGVDMRSLGETLYADFTRRLAEEQRTWSRYRGTDGVVS